MTPNPYQSPQHTGYDAPRPAAAPLWRRIVRVILVALAIAYVGWITIASVLAVVEYLRWQLGF